MIWPGSIAIENPEEADKEIASEKAAGYDFAKVNARVSNDAYLGILTAAKKQGLRVVGHVPDAEEPDLVSP